MKFILSALILSLCTTTQASELNTTVIKNLESYNGRYSNSRGDKLDFEFIAAIPKQSELFEENKPEFISLYIDFDLGEQSTNLFFDTSNENSLVFETTDGSYRFGFSDNDCQDSGCTTFDAKLTFIKKTDGTHYAVVEGSANSHIYEEINLPFLDNVPYESWGSKYKDVFYEKVRRGSNEDRKWFHSQVNEACSRQFGDNAYAGHFYSGDFGELDELEIYCEYSFKSFLKID